MNDAPDCNIEFANRFIEHLIALGVELFCVCPGSRNTPLLAALSKQDRVSTITFFDERVAGFFALGASKKTQKSTAIIVTSGTAGANLLPSIMEAKASFVPLLILTADRPIELQNRGANQTISQTSLFSDYVKKKVLLEAPNPQTGSQHLSSLCSDIYTSSICSPRGAVHINLPFRSPLHKVSDHPKPHITTVRYFAGENILSDKSAETIANELSSFDKGLILIGTNSLDAKLNIEIQSLANKTYMPIYAEGSSNFFTVRQTLCHLETLLEIEKELEPPEVVFLFGHHLISKNVSDWLKTSAKLKVYQFSDNPALFDPDLFVTDRIYANPATAIEKINHYLIDKTFDRFYLDKLTQSKDAFALDLKTFFSTNFLSFESGLLFWLSSHSENFEQLFIGNSSVARMFNDFFINYEKKEVFCSRGLSGIDGQIATAFGLAHASKKQTLAILGDQTALYDLNALSLAKSVKTPVTFLIINNFGGAIFQKFTYLENISKYDSFFANKHAFTFEPFAKGFDLEYTCLQSENVSEKQLQKLLKNKSHQIIEIHYPYENQKKMKALLKQSIKTKRSVCTF